MSEMPAEERFVLKGLAKLADGQREDVVHSKHATLAAVLQGLGMTLAF